MTYFNAGTTLPRICGALVAHSAKSGQLVPWVIPNLPHSKVPQPFLG